MLARLFDSSHSKILFSLVLVLMSLSLYAQNTLQGRVYDENSIPYSGANVILSNGNGAVSDEEGVFVFEDVSSPTYDFVVSAVGYNDQRFRGKFEDKFRDVYIVLVPKTEQIEQVTVVGDYKEKVNKSKSASIVQLDKEFLKESAESDLIQTISAIPGVSAMDVGTGASKPMIRGLGHYRVVVAQNGLKQEGQQWSNHHGVSMDQHAVGEVEVIKGSASLQYGSDAIGGVINTLPSRMPPVTGISGDVSLVGKSNTEWLGTAARLAWRGGDFYSKVALTYNSYGDFSIPKTDSFLLPSPVSSAVASHQVVLGNQLLNTAGRERAATISVGMLKSWGDSYFEFGYHGTKIGFFDWQGVQNDSTRRMHEEDGRDLNLPYQTLENYTINHHTRRYFDADKLEFSLGYQRNHSREYADLLDRTGNRKDALQKYKKLGSLETGLNLQTYTGNISYLLQRHDKSTFTIGLNTQYQKHSKDGYNHILPAYRRASTGVFITHKYEHSPKWILNSGVRMDYIGLDMDKTINPDADYGEPIFNKALNTYFIGTAFSIGASYNPTRHTTYKCNIGKSFRVPSVYELGAYGLHRHGGRFEQGDLRNKPEQAYQLDLSLERKWRKASFYVSPFVNYFTNYLYLTPTPVLRPEGQVFKYEQSQALLWGGEAYIDYKLGSRFGFKSGLEYVYAVNLDSNTALPFTPPYSIKTEVSYEFGDSLAHSLSKVALEVVHVGKQKYTVPNELTTDGYTTFNFMARTEVVLSNYHIDLMFKARNMLNSSYYNHTSFYRRLRIPEPGRDFQLYITIPITPE